MITLQHSLVTLFGLRGNEKKFEEEVPYVLLADAIRRYCGPRPYSHFEENSTRTDISWFKFPNNLKNITKDETLRQPMHLAENIKPAVIGERTHIKAFEEHNQHLSPIYYSGVKKHLTQDSIFDDFIREKIDCEGKYEDKYIFNGEVCDGKRVRGIIADIENHGLYVLAYMMNKSYGITANQSWFDEHVKKSLDRVYPEDLSNATYGYMKIPEEINKRITENDWTHLEEGPLPLKDYLEMYQAVVNEMPKIDDERVRREAGEITSEIPKKSSELPEGPEEN